MQVPSLPRAASRPSSAKLGLTAAIAAAGLGIAAPAAEAYYSETFTGSSIYWGEDVPSGNRHGIWQVSVNNLWNGSWARQTDIECAWAQNSPTGGTAYPGAATVDYAMDYRSTYGVNPPAFTGDYAGTPACVQQNVGYALYNDSTNVRRGINFKLGTPQHYYHSIGDQWWG